MTELGDLIKPINCTKEEFKGGSGTTVITHECSDPQCPQKS